MPTTTVSNGDAEEIYQGDQGDALFINTDSKIRVARTEQFARSGIPIQDNNPGQIELRENNESIWVYADGADATVNFRRQGFSLELFGREIFEVTNQVDTDVVAQSVGNFGTDIAAQSLAELTHDQARQSAKSVDEINADQTSQIPANGTQTTSITADSGEVWSLSGLYFEYTHNKGSIVDLDITVESKSQSVEWGFMNVDSFDNSGEAVYYRSGQWDVSGATNTASRDDIQGHIIDDTDGMSVVVEEQANNTTVDADRKIRAEFDVIVT